MCCLITGISIHTNVFPNSVLINNIIVAQHYMYVFHRYMLAYLNPLNMAYYEYRTTPPTPPSPATTTLPILT